MAVAILPLPTERGGIAYYGMAGEKRSRGSTAGQALDALMAQLPEAQDFLLVVLRSSRPDHFFDASQRQRLRELLDAWRKAKEAGTALLPEGQAELDALIKTEFRAAADRAAFRASEAGR
jgi:hypothetical protein